MNEQLEKIIQDNIPNNLHQTELERRIENIKSSLGVLEQMKKIPGIPKAHELFTLRSIAKDALGIKGESF